MKYTRYDLKRKKENSTMLIITLAFLFCCAYLIGIAAFKVFTKDKMGFINLNKIFENANSKNTINNTNSKNDKTSFVFIQGGLYENKDNAVQTCAKLSAFGNCFIVDEEKSMRVLLGIFPEEKANELCKKLSDSGIDNAKITYVITQKDLCDKEITEVINADIQILTKLSEKDVKAVETERLKKWIASLEKVDDKSKNALLLEEIKAYNKNLPEKLDKAKALEVYIYIYKFLNKLPK